MAEASPLKAALDASKSQAQAGRSHIGALVARRQSHQQAVAHDPKIKLAVTLDRSFHAEIKIHAALAYRTIEDIAREALIEYMERQRR